MFLNEEKNVGQFTDFEHAMEVCQKCLAPVIVHSISCVIFNPKLLIQIAVQKIIPIQKQSCNNSIIMK